MAYYSLHAYDADVWLTDFRGVNQAGAEIGSDIRYAVEAENVETPKGVLQPHAGTSLMKGGFEKKIETLMMFHRRWYDGPGSKDWLVAAVDGKLYYRQLDSASGNWIEIDMPSGITAFESSVWSFVTYETSQQGVDHPIDVLLISNAVDGMYMVLPPDRPNVFEDIEDTTFDELKETTFLTIMATADWTINAVDTQDYKFGVIERNAERVWGSAIADLPDKLVYSRPYDPTDWTGPTSDEQPEDAAGDIDQPTWDGDRFTALKTFGNQLIAFKHHHVWRVMGISPGEYTFTEQYGGGTVYPNTIAVDVDRIYMAGDDGMLLYDGASVRNFIRDEIHEIWKRANRAAMDQMCAVLHRDRYYLAFPIDGSATNNALLVYNKNEGTVLFYTDLNIEAFLSWEGVLYATSSTEPGKVHILHYDAWEQESSTGSATRWVSPWIDFGRKSVQKGGYELYFTPEVKGAPMTFTFSIQTEKKVKSKTVTVQTTTFKAKQKRIRFGGAGRRFRLIIETASAPTETVWRLIGGIHMVVETDPD